MMGEYVENVVYPAGALSIEVKDVPSNWEQTEGTSFQFVFKQKGATEALTEFWAHPNMM